MTNKRIESNWWKILIILTFIISLICLIILIPKPIYSYETKHIILNSCNMFEDWNVVDYTCDEGVEIHIGYFSDYVYASTSSWIGDADVNYGQCMFKIKSFEGWK